MVSLYALTVAGLEFIGIFTDLLCRWALLAMLSNAAHWTAADASLTTDPDAEHSYAAALFGAMQGTEAQQNLNWPSHPARALKLRRPQLQKHSNGVNPPFI